MYENAVRSLSEPAQIKRDLKLAYVVEAYGVALISDGQRLSGCCPFHADRTPSFDIYRWGDTWRWGCFSCGASGDVLDFIQRMSNVGFREACEVAQRGILKMQAEGWTAPQLNATFSWDAAAAQEMLWRGTQDGVEVLIKNKGWAFPASWACKEWGLRSLGGEVLFPVCDEDGLLVGMKHRPQSGARSLIALPGSRLRSTLYGAQRPAHGVVLLVEGESDAITASWLLRDLPVWVLGLPAGAGAAPTRLDMLEGRTAVLCFDGDGAGQLSAARWGQALAPLCDDILLLDPPAGHDISSLSVQDPDWLLSKLDKTL